MPHLDRPLARNPLTRNINYELVLYILVLSLEYS